MCFVMIRNRVVHLLYDSHILNKLALLNAELLVKIIGRHYVMSHCDKLVASRPRSKMKNVKLVLDPNPAQELH